MQGRRMLTSFVLINRRRCRPRNTTLRQVQQRLFGKRSGAVQSRPTNGERRIQSTAGQGLDYGKENLKVIANALNPRLSDDFDGTARRPCMRAFH
jgi:hypothetical protein